MQQVHCLAQPLVDIAELPAKFGTATLNSLCGAQKRAPYGTPPRGAALHFTRHGVAPFNLKPRAPTLTPSPMKLAPGDAPGDSRALSLPLRVPGQRTPERRRMPRASPPAFASFQNRRLRHTSPPSTDRWVTQSVRVASLGGGRRARRLREGDPPERPSRETLQGNPPERSRETLQGPLGRSTTSKEGEAHGA